MKAVASNAFPTLKRNSKPCARNDPFPPHRVSGASLLSLSALGIYFDRARGHWILLTPRPAKLIPENSFPGFRPASPTLLPHRESRPDVEEPENFPRNCQRVFCVLPPPLGIKGVIVRVPDLGLTRCGSQRSPRRLDATGVRF